MKIKVLSYNIHKGFDTLGARFILHELKEAIQQLNCDIVLLQEVVGENKNFSKKIKNWPKETQFEFLADTIWPHYSYGKNAVFDYRNHGNAILSKFPITYSENINISNNKLEQRGLLHAVVQIPELNEKSIHIFNTHLDLLHKSRRTQIEKIINRAQAHVPDNVPFIFGGDFNDWNKALSQPLGQFLGVQESFQVLHKKYAKSFPNFYPLLTLDRVYFRKLVVHSATTLELKPWSKLSDHLPLMIEFEIQ